MSRLVEAETPGHRDLIFPCDCHDDHFLRLTWDDDDQAYRYLWIAGVIRPGSAWTRVKAATRILLGREYCHTEIVLSPETVLSLDTFFSLVRGMEQAAQGEVVDRGSFAQYLDDKSSRAWTVTAPSSVPFR